MSTNYAPSATSSSNLNPNQHTGAQQPKKSTKLTWKYIPEPTPAQIAAAKENNTNSNNSNSNTAALAANSLASAPGGPSGSNTQGTVPISSQAMLGPIVTPQIKNHTATLYHGKLWVFGGYDGKKNHSSLRIFDTK